MKRHYIHTVLIAFVLLFSMKATAQIVGTGVFLQGKYLEVGSQFNGSLGLQNAPSGYHPHSGGASMCGSSSNTLAMVFDYGYDGWTTGSPPYMGDYTLPGSPWEAWGIEVGGTVCYAHSTSCGFTGTLTGSWTSYSNTGGRALGYWSGTTASGAVSIKKEYRVDTLSSCLVVTVVLKNTTASTVNNVYYIRSCDPDNSESWSGGAFTTINNIVYQNDYYHRVMVTAIATGSAAATGVPPQPMSLCTKDCRAKAIIYTSWPISSSCTVSALWAGSSSCVGTLYSSINASVTNDIAIGLIYNLCNIPAYDSATFSYAYVFNGSGGIDNAFPEPKMVVNGTSYDSTATLTACTGAFSGDTLPIHLDFASDKNWKWSDWTWSPAIGLLSTTGTVSGVVISSLSGTTTYTITGNDTSRGQCACAHKTFILTIVPATFGPPGVADVYYCQGDYASVLSATGVNLLWYTTATGGVGSTTAPTPSTSTPGMVTYYVSQSPCPPSESARVPIHVFVTPTPIIMPINNTPICAGDSLKLFGIDTFSSGAISYYWSGPGGFTSTLQNPFRAPAVTADSGVYTVTLTVNGCVSAPTSTLAVVHYTPPAPVVTPVTYCQYDATVPLIATGANLLWYHPASAAASASTPTPSSSSPGIDHYYVTQTLNGCESPRADLPVTVNPQPSVPVTVNPTYCQYDLPSPLSATGTSIIWYGPGIASTGTTVTPTPSTTVAGTFTYYATQTLLGCVSPQAVIVVTIIPKPAPPATLDTSYCQFTNAPALTAGGVNLKWYTTPTGGSALVGTPTPLTTTVGSTTWYVSQTVNGCESDRSALTVTILYLPQFTITQSRPFVCQLDTLSFSYTGPGITGAVYNWIIPNGASFVTGTASDPSVVVNFDSLYFQTVILSASSYYGRCTTSDTVNIHVVYQPSATAYIKENICEGDTVVLALSTHTGNSDSYNWNFDGATVITASSNSGGPYMIAFHDTGIHVITLQSFSTEGCKGLVTKDTVRVHALPDATIITTDMSRTICLEDSVWLRCRDEDHSKSYRWRPDHFFHNNNHSSIWGKIETEGYVTVTVTDAFGCTATDSIKFTPEACCTVAFPLAFTPNGDGRNDVFRPIFDGYHRFHSFRIANRWGQTVFESTNSTAASWDGTYAGIPQDMGVYFYFIIYDCDDNGKTGNKERTARGEVTLIR